VEALGYAFGAIPFPSAGVGAPHIRDRLYWVADANSQRLYVVNSPVRAESFGDAQADWCSETLYEKPGGVGGIRGIPEQLGRVGDTSSQGLGERFGDCRVSSGARGTDQGEAAQRAGIHVNRSAGAGPVNGLWRDADWLFCRDGKWRPVEPGTFPLAHGATARVGRLRAYGNAINVEAATQFIAAWLEAAQ